MISSLWIVWFDVVQMMFALQLTLSCCSFHNVTSKFRQWCCVIDIVALNLVYSCCTAVIIMTSLKTFTFCVVVVMMLPCTVSRWLRALLWIISLSCCCTDEVSLHLLFCCCWFDELNCRLFLEDVTMIAWPWNVRLWLYVLRHSGSETLNNWELKTLRLLDFGTLRLWNFLRLQDFETLKLFRTIGLWKFIKTLELY
jgi:hypothetical protein